MILSRYRPITVFDGDDGWFSEDDAAIFDIDEGIRCAEIDADVTGEKAKEFTKHALEKVQKEKGT